MLRLIGSGLLALLLAGVSQAGDSKVGGRTSPDGTESLACDLPGLEHMRNTGGTDGAGLCVFTSIEMAGRWQHAEKLRGFQQWMKKTHKGGGWPEKVEKMMKEFCPDVPYIQYSGSDPSVLKLAMKTGRMVGVTYGYSPRYSGKIAHMVDLVHLSDKWAAILDNNFPGIDAYEWMSPDEFYRRWKMGGGGWAVILLPSSPPPIPINGSKERGALAMNRSLLPTSAFVAALSLIPNALADWGGKPCGPVGPSVRSYRTITPVQQSPRYEWRRRTDDPNRRYLFLRGRQIGCWDNKEGYYRAFDDASDTWGEQCEPPTAPPRDVSHRVVTQQPQPPASETKPEESVKADESKFAPWELGGVVRDKMPDHDEIRINGQLVSLAEGKRLLGDDGLTDDSGKLRLTIIGKPEATEPVLTDWKNNSAFSSFRDKFADPKAYTPGAPGDWAVKTAGFNLDGVPRIVVQGPPGPDGKARVLHSQADYSDGPAGLAMAISTALREADPSYKPDKDQDKRKSSTPVLPDLAKLPMPVWLGLGALFLIMLNKREQTT